MKEERSIMKSTIWTRWIVAFVASFSLLFSACGGNDFEDAGETVDDAIEDMGEGMEDLGDDVEDAIE